MAITRADARQWDEPTFFGLSTDQKPTGCGTVDGTYKVTVYQMAEPVPMLPYEG